MKKSFILFFVASGLLFTSSCEKKNQEQQQSTQDTTKTEKKETGLSDDDKKFMQKAADAGMLEVELGKLAHTNASSTQVKELGHMMMTHHQEANNQLKQLASNKNVMLPDSLSNDAKDKLEKLKGLKGKEFDKKYLNELADAHKKDVSDFENEADQAQDPELKSWVQATLPTLKTHLMEVKKTDSLMKKSDKKMSSLRK
jgi:putative membrane protein